MAAIIDIASAIFNNRKQNKRDTSLKAFGEVKDDSFNFGQIEAYFRKKDNSASFQVLSDKTCNDLDFQELFIFVDRTSSRVGQQFLYNKLRTISYQPADTKGQEKIIEEFITNSSFRLYVQAQLSKLSDTNSYYLTSFFQDNHIQPPKWLFMVRILSFASLLSLVLLLFNSAMVLVLIGLFFTNIIIHFWNKKNLAQYINSLPQLLRLNGVARELFKNQALKGINPNLQESITVIDGVRNRMSFFRVEASLQSDMAAVFWSMLELVKILFLLEPLLLFGILRQLDTKRKEVEDLFTFVGQVDALVSVASLRTGLDKYSIPTIAQGQKEIVAQEVYHPLIVDCVKNSIHVDAKSILLTGSNMSGKTSFIRTIGINVITGLTLNTCFAEQFTMPRMRIYSAIRISDDLMNDRSFYFEEVLTIKEMIEESGSGIPSLFLLDEIFKGTNTVERISAGKAVLSYLTKADNTVFVSTHDIELADLLNEEYELYHFSEQVDNKTIDFDYKLKVGKLKNRNAISILQINDYPTAIIDEAIEIAKELDKVTVVNSSQLTPANAGLV